MSFDEHGVLIGRAADLFVYLLFLAGIGILLVTVVFARILRRDQPGSWHPLMSAKLFVVPYLRSRATKLEFIVAMIGFGFLFLMLLWMLVLGVASD